jgi:hypothetical protein
MFLLLVSWGLVVSRWGLGRAVVELDCLGGRAVLCLNLLECSLTLFRYCLQHPRYSLKMLRYLLDLLR